MEFDKVFRALGDKHRLFIMDLLMEREMNAGELLEKVNVVQSTLSHHMKCLCESGLVTARKEGKWTYYSVSSEAVEAARVFLKRYLEEIPEGTKVLTKKEVPEKEEVTVKAQAQEPAEAFPASAVPVKEQDGQGRTVLDDRKKAKKKKADKEQKNGEKKKPGDKKKVPVKKENAKEGKKEEKKKQKRGDKKGSGKKGDRKARENTEKR